MFNGALQTQASDLICWVRILICEIAEKRREAKGKGEKERYIHLNAEFQRIARRDRKPSSVINAKKKRKTIE